MAGPVKSLLAETATCPSIAADWHAGKDVRASIWSARPRPQMSDSRLPRPAAASVDSPSLAPNWFSISSPAMICMTPQPSYQSNRPAVAPDKQSMKQ